MDQPLISMIIPAHNVAPFLPRCVDSILCQKSVSLELILVDDSSTDETGAICEAYAARDPRVRVLHRSYRDLSQTRNAGMEIARGEYIGFSDGDDVVSPRLLQAVGEVLSRQRPEMIRYGFRMVFADGTGEDWVLPYPQGPAAPEELGRQRLDGICTEHVLDYTFPKVQTAWSHMFSRELIRRAGLRFRPAREILSEDYLFVLQALYAARSIYHLAAPYYDYIEHHGSLSRSLKPRMMERKKNLIQAYMAFLPMEDPEVTVRLRNFYIDSVYDCFYNAATECSSLREAMERIRPLLRDAHLVECIRKNRDRIVSRKSRCICFLMARRMGLTMYVLHRLLHRRKKRGT